MKIVSRKKGEAIGWNDADYTTRFCPYYRVWKQMLTRAHDPEYHKTHPAYKGVTVCKKWLVFTPFKGWMEQQDWQGKQLDKDLIYPGNQEYSPDACCFVSQELNSLFTGGSARNGLPRGVSWNSKRKKYVAVCSIKGRDKHIGYYNTVSEALNAYLEVKRQVIEHAAAQVTNKRLANGLLFRSWLLT